MLLTFLNGIKFKYPLHFFSGFSHEVSNKHSEEEKENRGVDDTVANSAPFIDKEREASNEVISTELPSKDKEDKKEKDKTSKLKVILLEDNCYWNF